MKKPNLKKVLIKAIPLWLVVLLIVNSSFVFGLAEYYFLKKALSKNLASLSGSLNNSDQLITSLRPSVLPTSGYKTALKWRALGQQLVDLGAIDLEKYKQTFTNVGDGAQEMKHLQGEWDDDMTINQQNARFMVDTLWALGLVNKSQVLDEGPMKTAGLETAKFASTAGWTLGTKDAMKLYSSAKVVPLTAEQEALVKKIAETVYRPCCNNSTAFPDCNHGMAALGYIEWAVASKESEEQIYKDLLAFNSFWFPQNYLELAAYFQQQGTSWDKVDPKLALGANFSSAGGSQKVRQSVQPAPAQGSGGGCST